MIQGKPTDYKKFKYIHFFFNDLEIQSSMTKTLKIQASDYFLCQVEIISEGKERL